MRRALMTAALAVAALPAAAGAAPAPASAVPAPVTLKLVRCSIEEHEAAFYARMQQLPGASRMAMRFTLLEETGGDGSKRVKVPGLHHWRWSKPGVTAFGYRQGFRSLPANASYRVSVEFRWYADDGSEVMRAKRRSARCRQFVERPNLVARITAILPTDVSGVIRYEAVVSNSGKAAANSIPVRLTVDGVVVDTVTLASLAPGEERSLAIRGPPCHGLVRLEADPEKDISESSELDNIHELNCVPLR